jgi:hypothetical protein
MLLPLWVNKKLSRSCGSRWNSVRNAVTGHVVDPVAGRTMSTPRCSLSVLLRFSRSIACVPSVANITSRRVGFSFLKDSTRILVSFLLIVISPIRRNLAKATVVAAEKVISSVVEELYSFVTFSRVLSDIRVACLLCFRTSVLRMPATRRRSQELLNMSSSCPKSVCQARIAER